MAEMTTTGHTDNLGPMPIGIGQSSHRAGNLLVEAGPAAARMELGVRNVKRGSTPPADVRAFIKEVVVLAGVGRFGAFVNDHPLFLRCQFVHSSPSSSFRSSS